MATKKPSAATQLKQAKADIERLMVAATAAESAKKSVESSKDYYNKRASAAEEELEQLHGLLDAFEWSLPRTLRKEGDYQDTKYTAMTRLASWLAKK